MTDATLIAAGHTLAVAPASLPKALTDAWSLSMVWSQSIARKSSNNPASSTYFSALYTELSRISWIVEDADKNAYKTDNTSTSPASVIETIADPYLSQENQNLLSQSLAQFKTGNDPKLKNFLTTWWDDQSQSMESTSFSMSPLFIDNKGQLTTQLFYMNFDVARSGWQSFFVSDLKQSTSVQTLSVELALQDQIWTQIRDKIADKLGVNARDYIRHLDISL